MQLLDGRKAREYYADLLKKRIAVLPFAPCLAIIQVGTRHDSDSFIKAKKSFAKKIGVNEIHLQLDEKISQKDIIDIIKKYNNDKKIQGIIVQLPLPAHLDPAVIVDTIDPRKDTDGLTLHALATPATARGIAELLDFYSIDLTGKKVTVIGQSKLVGRPISKMCRDKKAIVTVCDSRTKDLESVAKSSDILIVAIGKPGFIDKKYISVGQVVIDVGITREGDDLKGDVDFENVKDIVSAITPVPGGVGVMTVLALFENLIDACYTEKYE